MSARIEASEDSHPGLPPKPLQDPSAGPRASVRALPPGPIEVGGGTALLIDGELDPAGLVVSAVRIRLGDLEQEVDAFGMPEPRSYAAGRLWWVVLVIPGSTRLGTQKLELVAETDRGRLELELGSLELVGGLDPPASPSEPPAASTASTATVAICMATYEPRADQLARQLESIRGQSHESWICLISDDCSSDLAYAELESQIADDSRFVLSRSSERLGFYRNFGRALRMVPEGVELVCFADQDDHWDPDKLDSLAALLAANPEAALGYSDMRIATDAGQILSDTFWYLRRNNYDDIASLVIANTITGAASMFRRELLEVALPLPPGHPGQHPYHDHWLALCALGLGPVAYLDRPTYDYTRHVDSVTVRAQPQWLAPPTGRWDAVLLRLRRVTRRFRRGTPRPGGRSIYFKRYLLMRQFISVLELRIGGDMDAPKRRKLRRLAAAERSMPAAGWLLLRSLRPLIGRNETLASERVIFLGLLWRRVVGRRARSR